MKRYLNELLDIAEDFAVGTIEVLAIMGIAVFLTVCAIILVTLVRSFT